MAENVVVEMPPESAPQEPVRSRSSEHSHESREAAKQLNPIDLEKGALASVASPTPSSKNMFQPAPGTQVFYVIDAETLMNGKALIGIKEKGSNPGPIGLLGFGLTTFLLNLHNAGAFELNSMILAMGLAYGGLAQIIAGIMEQVRGNFFAAVAFISYGFFWWSFVFLKILPKMGYAEATEPDAMGFYLFIWGLFTLCMFFATLLKRAPWMLSWLFITLVVLFWLLAIADWITGDSESLTNASNTIVKVAGYEGMICGLSAVYIAFGEILNESAGRTILWLGVRKPREAHAE
eukprot:CAMPEP_0184691550 /NCGR_PEP_ID=MMETSP0313-20130426/373_1 /TAXON_ID=2792 /ORGANISM="Porphyridium aerugineum, Strain SAG 1380-2" /LENGTH=291 /DNA_ID=CAMNT_0027149293 /DNA_START=145 /DNA_END=1020 /DNA_ORIENTATION=+